MKEHEASSVEGELLAIIPAYNEEDTIRGVVENTKEYVNQVLVVDDNSTDRTLEIAKDCADLVVSHETNKGVGGAVYTGYQVGIENSFEYIVQLDSDGQHDPEYIPSLLEKQKRTCADMVIGSRWLNESYKRYSIVRRMGIRFFSAEVSLLGGVNITDVTSGYRIYRASMLENLDEPSEDHWAIEQTLEAARKNYKIVEESVPMPPRTDGSQFDTETFFKYPVRMIIATIKVLSKNRADF